MSHTQYIEDEWEGKNCQDLEMTITVLPQYSPRRTRRLFDLDNMRKGGNIGFI